MEFHVSFLLLLNARMMVTALSQGCPRFWFRYAEHYVGTSDKYQSRCRAGQVSVAVVPKIKSVTRVGYDVRREYSRKAQSQGITPRPIIGDVDRMAPFLIANGYSRATGQLIAGRLQR